MKPNCPIPQWEYSFATDYCTKIKSLGPMWRKSKGFGNKTLLQFRGCGFTLCSITKQVWFPGCPGSHYEDCKKFLYAILDDWKEAFEEKKIEEYPMAYLAGMVEKSVRGGDWYFETLKRRQYQSFYEREEVKTMAEVLMETVNNMPWVQKDEVEIKRSQLHQKIRFQVLNRDNFRCSLCGRDKNDGVKLHVDHKIPLARGGTNDLDNLQALCEDCNMGKGATVFEQLITEQETTNA